MNEDLKQQLMAAYAGMAREQIEADLQASQWAGVIDVSLVAAYVEHLAGGAAPTSE